MAADNSHASYASHRPTVDFRRDHQHGIPDIRTGQTNREWQIMNPAGTTASNRPDMGWFIGSFALSVFTMMVFPCICGHLQTEALPTSILGAAFAWFPFIRYKRTRIFDRWFTLFLVLFSTLILIKNIADILWFGHESLLR